MKSDKPNIMNTDRRFWVGLISFTAFILFVCILPYLFTSYSLFGLDFSSTGAIGDTIGGTMGPFIAIAAAVLTFLAFWVQYQANIEQKRQFDLSSNLTRLNTAKGEIESRFFELLKIHIENRNNVIQKQGSFQELIDELQEIVFSIESTNSKLSPPLAQSQIYNIGYALFFHGVFKKTLSGNYSFQQVSKICKRYSSFESPELASSFLEILQGRLKGSNQKSIEDFKGTQDVLGHYYRHLFQTVKYINNQPPLTLSYEEKYQYIKTLRAQLSTSEQLLFFYNSVSDLGKSWEFDEALDANHKLITKYNLIRNIPVDILSYPKVRDRFPLVVFEADKSKSKERIEVEKKYEAQ